MYNFTGAHIIELINTVSSGWEQFNSRFGHVGIVHKSVHFPLAELNLITVFETKILFTQTIN